MSDYSELVKLLRSPATVFYEYGADGGALLKDAAARIAELVKESEARLADASTAWDLCESRRVHIEALEKQIKHLEEMRTGWRDEARKAAAREIAKLAENVRLREALKQLHDAAAPELYPMTAELLEIARRYESGDFIQRAEAILAKARGEI